MCDRRGSVTVISLVFLLFLFILGGSWLVMMTQEKTNAMGDQKQQQAWYAAEAGYRRALAQIKYSVDSSVNMSWLNKSSDFKGTATKHYNVSSLAESTTSTDQGPWYAVMMEKNGVAVDPGTVAVAKGDKFSITVMGQYMGERKIIQRTYTTTNDSTSSSSGSNIKDGSSGHVLSNKGVISAKGSVNLTSKSTLSTNSSTAVYGSTATSTQNVTTTTGSSAYDSSYSSTVYGLSIPDEVFTSNKYKKDSTKGTSWYTTVDVLNGDSLEFDTNTIQVNGLGANDVTGKSGNDKTKGNVCYVEGSGEIKRAIQGPTGTTEDDVLTIVCNGDLTISGSVTGNVRFLVKGTLTFNKLASEPAAADSNNNLMLVANGGLNVYRSIKYGLLVCAGGVDYSIDDTVTRTWVGNSWKGHWVYTYSNNGYFYGQILSEGDVTVNVGTLIYSDTVSKHAGFEMPYVS